MTIHIYIYMIFINNNNYKKKNNENMKRNIKNILLFIFPTKPNWMIYFVCIIYNDDILYLCKQ